MTIAGTVETKDYRRDVAVDDAEELVAMQMGAACPVSNEYASLVLHVLAQGETYQVVIVGPQARALNFLINENDRVHLDGLVSTICREDIDGTLVEVGFDIDPVRIQFPMAKQMSDWFPIHQGVPIQVDPAWANQPPR